MTVRERLSPDRVTAGTFIKTPSVEIIEIMALAGIGFICFDAEHSAFGRRELDGCLALARALGVPSLVRLSHASPETILQVLDGGADGIVVPHVSSLEKARDVARWARFGGDGRGYAGSTRSAGFTTYSMAEVLARNCESLLIVQIEDPSALGDVDEIAALPGVDGLFFGAADMAVGMGLEASSGTEVDAAFETVARAARSSSKLLAAYCTGPEGVPALARRGVSLAFVGSDHGLVLAGARTIAGASQT